MMRQVPARGRRPAALSGWARDAAAAVILTIVVVLVTRRIQPAASDHSIDPLGYALLVVASASVACWRRWPRTMLVVVVVAIGAYVARGYPNGPVLATGWLALLAVSWRTNRRTAMVAGTGLCAALGVAAVIDGGDAPLPFLFIGWSAAAVFLGDALRNRRDYLRELEERAHYLERTREEEARRLVAEERLRIARDLHDSVAHAMATINVQASAVAHVVDRRPEMAKDAFLAIQRASGDVLDELAAMLALLRDDGQAADRAPTPGIDQITQLVGTVTSADLHVRLSVEGSTDGISKPIGTAAYRIVQESLTNVIRHAGTATARVAIRVGDDRGLLVEVCDDGAGARSRATGMGVGIRGMRERAVSTGGVLEAGPASNGGFTVRAVWATTT